MSRTRKFPPWREFALLAVLIVELVGLINCQAQIDWPLLTQTSVTTNVFPAPTFITHAGDGSGRLFVGQQSGRIRILLGSNALSTPFLDLTTPVLSGWERGLLGMAFAPGFATNGHFYVNYTRKPDGATVVSRFTAVANADVVQTNTEQVILVVPQPYENHNGGQLAFGPDGYLYIGFGDGGAGGDPLNRAQNPNTLLGKVLRIDVESGVAPYAIPASNPFVGNTNYAPEIWALGVRNPWRFSFDRLTGDLYIADVGEVGSEEVNFQSAGSPGGQNYGWNVFEGLLPFRVPPGFDASTLTFPVTIYSRSLGWSVTGGFVHRAAGEPRMNGIYFFGDFGQGRIFGLAHSGTNWLRRELSTTPYSYNISTFGEGEDGKLYFANYSSGQIYLLGDSHEVLPPQLMPPGGYFNAEQDVLVTSATPGTALHFTIDGSEPTLNAPLVPTNGFIHIASNVVLTVRGFRNDLLPSAVVAGEFTLQVATPELSPAEGPITNGTLVSISCTTTGSLIRFTTNGEPPDAASPIYTAPFFVNGDTVIQAQGLKEGFTPSEVAYTFLNLVQVEAPLISPEEQYITNGTLVSITGPTPNAIYRFTLDGTEPDTNSFLYTGPFAIDGETLVSARGFRHDMTASEVVSVYYPLHYVPQPLFDPPNGPVTNGQPITITCPEPDATLTYTLDGTDPTLASLQYTGSVVLSGNQTLIARAFRAHSGDSEAQAVRYDLWIPNNTVVSTIAGSGLAGFVNGDRRLARFNYPQGVCVDPTGNVYVADFGNHAIRRIGTNGMVSTVAGNGNGGFSDGTSTNAQFNQPVGICLGPDGNLYVSDRENRRIRRVSPAGLVTTLASGLGGYLTHLTFAHGAFYFGAGAIVQTITTNGVLAVVPSGPNVYDPSAVADEQTNVFVVSSYIFVDRFRYGIGTDRYAGSMPQGFADGPLLQARIPQYPAATRGIVRGSVGNLFMSDPSRIRRITTNGLSTLAGTEAGGYADGSGRSAQFYHPAGLALDLAGNVFVADAANHRIRKISIDEDSDLIPDMLEGVPSPYLVGTDDRAVDSDGDGLSNSQEYLAGSSPTDAQSLLGAASVVLQTNGMARIEWLSAEDKTYSVESSDNFEQWTIVAANIFGTGGQLSATDARAPSPNQRVYRIVVRPF